MERVEKEKQVKQIKLDNLKKARYEQVKIGGATSNQVRKRSSSNVNESGAYLSRGGVN